MQQLIEDSEYSDLGIFWKISKVRIHMYFFFHFLKNSLFGFENCGKFSGNFGKCNALGFSIPLEEYVYKFSARLLKNSSKMHLPQNKLFHPKSVFSKKSCTPKNGSSPKIVSSRKKSTDPEKMFHLKNVTNPKMFLR